MPVGEGVSLVVNDPVGVGEGVGVSVLLRLAVGVGVGLGLVVPVALWVAKSRHPGVQVVMRRTGWGRTGKHWHT